MIKKQTIFITMILLITSIQVSHVTAFTNRGSGFKLADGVYDLHQIENITLQTEYQISSDFSNWKVTGNKAIDMRVKCNTNPNNATILIEHMHCDMIIESTISGFDEITQDSMDDSMHGIQGGFLITTDYSYYETFSIEGSSPEFQEICTWVYSSYYASSDTTTYKFSEERLIQKYGVYGTTLYVVYDVLVKYENEDYFHKYIITDNLFIDTNGDVVDNNGNIADVEAEPMDMIDGYQLWLLLPVSLFVLSVIIAYKTKKRC